MSNFTRIDWFDNIEFRTHPHQGLNWFTAMLCVENPQHAAQLYERVFGIIPIFQASDETGQIVFIRMRYRGANFTLNKPDSFNFKARPLQPNAIPPCTFYIYVDDVFATYQLALNNNFTSLEKPTLQFWGDTRAQLQDPYGYLWEIATLTHPRNK